MINYKNDAILLTINKLFYPEQTTGIPKNNASDSWKH